MATRKICDPFKHPAPPLLSATLWTARIAAQVAPEPEPELSEIEQVGVLVYPAPDDATAIVSRGPETGVVPAFARIKILPTSVEAKIDELTVNVFEPDAMVTVGDVI